MSERAPLALGWSTTLCNHAAAAVSTAQQPKAGDAMARASIHPWRHSLDLLLVLLLLLLLLLQLATASPLPQSTSSGTGWGVSVGGVGVGGSSSSSNGFDPNSGSHCGPGCYIPITVGGFVSLTLCGLCGRARSRRQPAVIVTAGTPMTSAVVGN